MTGSSRPAILQGQDPVSRICVVLLTGLGDVVHGLPVVNVLKRDDPARHITWITEPMPAEILRHHPAIDEVVLFERRRGWRGVLDILRQLQGREFDLTINLNIYAKSIFPTVFSAAPHRLGFGRERTRDWVWLFSNHHLPPPGRGSMCRTSSSNSPNFWACGTSRSSGGSRSRRRSAAPGRNIPATCGAVPPLPVARISHRREPVGK